MACASQIWPRAPQRDCALKATHFRALAEVTACASLPGNREFNHDLLTRSPCIISMTQRSRRSRHAWDVLCVAREQHPIYCDKSTCDPEQTSGLTTPFPPELRGENPTAGKRRGVTRASSQPAGGTSGLDGNGGKSISKR